MSSPSDPSVPRPTPSASGLASGATVGGDRYLLKKVLGQGGMGVVWLAHDKRLREPVALKFLPTQISFDPTALDDLRRETLRSRKLSHSNVVRIHDLYEATNELAFISMEYVDGPNLHYLRAHRPAQVLRWRFLAPLVRQLCAALDYAHGERVIHRDLKPANLMLDSNERLKLADFGLACVVHDSITRMSGLQAGAGTLDFMSPQQADGKKPQITDDIYSLGATLYELLTSRPPFYSGDIAYQVRNTRPQTMNERLLDLELTNEIPSEVSALVMACLETSEEQRPQSAKAILEWLDAVENPKASVQVAPAQETHPPPPQPSPAIVTPQPAQPIAEVQTAPPAQSPVASPPPEPPPDIVSASAQRQAVPEPVPSPPQSDPSFTHGHSRTSIRFPRLPVRWIVTGSAVLALLGIATWLLVRPRQSAPGNSPAAAEAVSGEQGAGDFEVLFDGRDLTGWEVDSEYWSVRDGALTGQTFRNSPPMMNYARCLAGPFDDFELRLSFQVLDGNSGVLYRCRDPLNPHAVTYQCELWKNMTAGLLDSPPRLLLANPGQTVRATRANNKDLVNVEGAIASANTAFKPFNWNELRIVAQGNRLRHFLNGQLVMDATDENELYRHRSGYILLELANVEGGGAMMVQFKDIRLRRLVSLRSDGFESLFNGRDLTGWDGDANIWSVKDGVLTGDVVNRSVSGRKGPHLFWKGQADDFELRLSFQLERGNSGIFYRGKHFEDGNVAGYQFEIWKDNIGGLMDTGPERSRRDFVKAEKFQRYVKKNDWNDVVITAQGNRLVHKLNGAVMADVTDTDKNRQMSAGLFALEMFGPTIIHLKDVRLKRLRAGAVPTAAADSVQDKTF